MDISNYEVSVWRKEYKDSIVRHIDSLDYQNLKNMHFECESSIISLVNEVKNGNSSEQEFIKDRKLELDYIIKSLDFCKTNISNSQYDLLNDFANIQYFYKHRNTNPNEKLDSSFWAEILDKNNISWSLQNLVSAITDEYENKGLYLSTHFKKHEINMGTLDNRVEELGAFYDKEKEPQHLEGLLENYENRISTKEETIAKSNIKPNKNR